MLDKVKDWWNNLPDVFLGIKIKKITPWLIGGFLVTLFIMLSVEDANAHWLDDADTSIELAPSVFVSGERYNAGVLTIEERWKNKYALGIGLSTEWRCPDDCKRADGPQNQYVYAQRVVQYKKFEIGLGVSYWHNKSPAWNSHTPFALHLGWNFNEKVSVRWKHYSTGGSSSNNAGLDFISVGWTF